MGKKAIIIGAGPAGLTAAYELLQRTGIVPIILEKSEYIGGISRTTNYKGNRMDMGPHRFFSKSDRVMNWWLNIMPLQTDEVKNKTIRYQNKSRELNTEKKENISKDKVMLLVHRLTRIYFLRNFFAYPIQLSFDTLKTLGLVRTCKIIASYIWIKFHPIKEEKSLEDFIINKFGKQLYLLFFKDYTEKVWGVPCHEISAEWGAQRIKGVSLSKAIAHAISNLKLKKSIPNNLSQKSTETSLIEQFLYPKYGPGSLWEEVARIIEAAGGKIHLNQQVEKIVQEGDSITAVHTIDQITGELAKWEGEFFFSTMPVQELIAGMGTQVPEDVRNIAAGLQYRDFINVGILLKQLSKPSGKNGEFERLDLKDNWIYIQEKDVKVGRLMIYNNWGGGMVNNPDTTWIGMEYFCNKSDKLWSLENDEIKALAINELEKMALCRIDDVIDATVQRMEKTYPAYFGTYNQFDRISAYTDRFTNLFLIGRNGMHKYNNADHSMLTAMVSVDNISAGITTKNNIWAINTEQEYHEEKKLKEVEDRPKVPQSLTHSFIKYSWNENWKRISLLLTLLLVIVQLIIFKFRYPFANYMPDSYSYLQAAYSNADVNMWPVAYSKFLRLLSTFTHSDKILVILQYFWMQLSLLSFILTLFYFFKPRKLIWIIILAFYSFNPIPIYISNYISADSLFIGCSFLWFTTLIWILFQPTIRLLILQAALLWICFILRYYAIYYPIIMALAFIKTNASLQYKLGGIALGSILIAISISYTSQKMLEETGKRQFSAFAGWQLANNALYMYEHIPSKERVPVPTNFMRLDNMVRQHIDTIKKVNLSHEDSLNQFFYLWSLKGPLVQFEERDWAKDSSITPYFKRWSSEGPIYKDYALFLIRKYPISFVRHFIIPNTIRFAVPPTEFLTVYNMGADSVDVIAKTWFQYKNQKIIDNKNKWRPSIIIEWYPIFSTLVNILFLLHILGLLLLNQLKYLTKNKTNLLLLVTTFWLVNFLFSSFSSPIVLRYQIFPIWISFTIAIILGGIIYTKENNTEKE